MSQKKYLPVTAFLLGAGLICRAGLPVCGQDVSEPKTEYIVTEKEAASQLWPDLREVHIKVVEKSSVSRTSPEDVLAPRDHAFTQEELSELFGDLTPHLDTGSFTLNTLNQAPWRIPAASGMPGAPDVPNYRLVTWSELQAAIEGRLASYQGDWSVYIKDLSTGNTMEINEHSMESASLIKLFIAGTIYEQIELGNLEETETIMNALNRMITVSDNESSNVLVRQLYGEGESFQDGLDVVNDFIRRHGFSNTQQVNGIADPSLWVSDGSINMTSPADCGRLLEMVYNGELVSHFNSFRFEVLLNKQEVNYKIPAGIPSDVHISHKTGEVDDTENDAAIIYTPYGDYIFCIMSTDLTDTGSAVDHIHEISGLVYDYFTAEDRETAANLLAKWEG